jgi:hypothetical protein
MSLPTLQQPANVVDFVALQMDCLAALLSAPQLAKVNFIAERKFLVQSDIEITSLWQTQRNGASGAGTLCEMPKIKVISPNVSGPAFELELGFVTMEQRDFNFTPTVGTFLTAEQISQLIFDVLHLAVLEPYGTLRARGITPAYDWIDAESGIISQRATLFLTSGRSQTPRVQPLTIIVANGLATLSTTTAGAEIYYTLDGSFPSRADGGNAASLKYDSPIAVSSGDVLRAVGYLDGSNLSAARRFTVP